MKQKKSTLILDILLPLLLVVYSLLLVNQGITVTDTGYNYGNFIHFDTLDGMWKFSTYLASALGAFFTRLPFGHTMVGLNVYTGLVKALIAVITYLVCVYGFGMKKWLVFAAELMALGYCWCPTALLYNYCTYLLFNLGAILLCLAVKKEKNYLYLLAGVCLGLNVMVRLPNLAEMALILALWFYCVIRKIRFSETMRRTALCILGYVLGVGTVLAYIFIRYGATAYFTGIQQLMDMSKVAYGYSLRTMIVGDIKSYLENLKWLWIALLFVLAGTALFAIGRKRFLWVKRVVYLVSNGLLIFVFLKLHMFGFIYYAYDGIFYWGIFFLIISGLLGLYVMFFGGQDYELRMHAITMGIIILITPLGSNNYLFTAVNNLFWVTPFVFHCCYKFALNGENVIGKKIQISLEPLKITLTFLVAFACMQGMLFGTQFVFRDGIRGEKRTAQIADNEILAGMYTSEANAETIGELNDYLNREGLKGSEVILYYNVPALAYYMELNPVLSSTWPDLESFTVDKFQEELNKIRRSCEAEGDKPLIIMGCSLEWDTEKLNLLKDFCRELSYEQVFQNEMFFVYR